MSIQALAWAFKQKIKPSSLKFVLVALADCANENEGMLLWPSIAHICDTTSLDKKTVKRHLARLKSNGLLSDTGERVGRTKQIKVYKLHSDKRSQKGSVKEAPFPPERGPKWDLLKRPQMGPRNPYTRTLKEPRGNSYGKGRYRNDDMTEVSDSKLAARINSFRKTGLWRNEWGATPT